MQISIEIQDMETRRNIAAMAARGENLRPLMLDIGDEIYRVVQKNFDEGGRPEAWKPSARSRRDGGKPLTDTGRLRRSFSVDADSVSVRVGTNDIRARLLFLGGKTKPHEIRPKNKKALAWPGAAHPVKAVHHPGSNFPARNPLVIPDADQRRISQIAADYIGGKKL